MYTHNISLPSGSNAESPYLPMVNAIPPNAPIGDNFITHPNALNK